jgi:hypothetical protein
MTPLGLIICHNGRELKEVLCLLSCFIAKDVTKELPNEETQRQSLGNSQMHSFQVLSLWNQNTSSS